MMTVARSMTWRQEEGRRHRCNAPTLSADRRRSLRTAGPQDHTSPAECLAPEPNVHPKLRASRIQCCGMLRTNGGWEGSIIFPAYTNLAEDDVRDNESQALPSVQVVEECLKLSDLEVVRAVDTYTPRRNKRQRRTRRQKHKAAVKQQTWYAQDVGRMARRGRLFYSRLPRHFPRFMFSAPRILVQSDDAVATSEAR